MLTLEVHAHEHAVAPGVGAREAVRVAFLNLLYIHIVGALLAILVGMPPIFKGKMVRVSELVGDAFGNRQPLLLGKESLARLVAQGSRVGPWLLILLLISFIGRQTLSVRDEAIFLNLPLGAPTMGLGFQRTLRSVRGSPASQVASAYKYILLLLFIDNLHVSVLMRLALAVFQMPSLC